MGGSVERHNNFDALRLIAAVSVIFSHAFLIGEGTQDPEPLYWATGGQTVLGVVGVFVFFTISGYLVSQSFEATGAPLRFLAKRGLRIYPGLLACLLLSAFIMGPLLTDLPLGAYFRSSAVYSYVASNFAMILPTNTLPGVAFTGYGAGSVVDGPLWTLPSEVAMYLMVCVLGTLGALRLRVILPLLLVGLCGLWFDTASSEYFIGSALWLLPFFAAGMALYRLRDRPILHGAAALAALAALAVSAWLHAFILLFPIFGSYLVIYLAFARWLPVLRAARFGDLSYGLYIYGWPIEQWLTRLQGGTLAWSTLFALALPLSALAALLSWHMVESRALRLKPANLRRGGETRAPLRPAPLAQNLMSSPSAGPPSAD
ncbi:MAG TPA: acyltransferase [Stellaceae bacterium]|nr:acyltransferase [Stellaceae bacterium]